MAPLGAWLGPKPWRREKLQGLDDRLPPSVQKTHISTPRVLKPDSVAAAYHWRPVQIREHLDSKDNAFSCGTYVTTLTMDINEKTYEGSTSHLIRLSSEKFTSKSSLWCYLIGGSFVVCKGTVLGSALDIGVPARVGRLPSNSRPRHELKFPANCREAFDVGGHVSYTSHLATLRVTPDGWIFLVPHRSTEGAIDLSAIRFCTSGGISLIDDVTLHTVQVAGTRMCCLQGRLTERFFTVHSHKPVALLPESCRPQRELPFVVCGSSEGGYNLLVARPSYGAGVGGDLMWRDSVWNHDIIHFTGLMYEVKADALSVSTLDSQWSGESMTVFVRDFQKHLIRKFGTIDAAWHKAFDTDGSGSVNFTEFGLGCKASGYVGNATRLWAALDDDRSGGISLDELKLGLADRADSPSFLPRLTGRPCQEETTSASLAASSCTPRLDSAGKPQFYETNLSSLSTTVTLPGALDEQQYKADRCLRSR